MICPNCGHYFRMDSFQRAKLILDVDSFLEFDSNLHFQDPLSFPGYAEKAKKDTARFGIKEAIRIGVGTINGIKTAVAIMDFHFRMGSMGQIVGEKIQNIVNYCIQNNCSLIIFTNSGGARMQEGVFSLYQMANTVHQIDRLKAAKLLNVTVQCDPTTGGVSASFASNTDYIIVEKHAQIGFAGKRVVNNTLKSENYVKEDIQTAESHFKYGHADVLIDRKKLKEVLYKLLRLHTDTSRDESKDNVLLPKVKNIPKVNEKFLENLLVSIRDINRPSAKDYIPFILYNIFELHGDRNSSDDASIMSAVAFLNKQPVTLIAQVHSRDSKINAQENFGMTRPAGYKKVIRSIRLAERYNRPIITLVDTKGANPFPDSERHNQSYCISRTIESLLRVKTPVISIII